jgi:amino acid transporter
MTRKKNKKICMSKCKTWLAWLWLIMFGFILLLLMGQHVLGKYDYKIRVEKENNIWEVKNKNKSVEAGKWLIISFIPLLSLIVAALAQDILRKKKKKRDRKVSRSTFRLFFFLSLLYLTVVSLVILVNPFSSHSQVELMKQSKVWLLPSQVVVGIGLGAFFIAKKDLLDLLVSFLGFIKG